MISQNKHQPTGLIVALTPRQVYLRSSEENVRPGPAVESGPQEPLCSGITVSLLSMNFQNSLKPLFRKPEKGVGSGESTSLW